MTGNHDSYEESFSSLMNIPSVDTLRKQSEQFSSSKSLQNVSQIENNTAANILISN